MTADRCSAGEGAVEAGTHRFAPGGHGATPNPTLAWGNDPLDRSLFSGPALAGGGSCAGLSVAGGGGSPGNPGGRIVAAARGWIGTPYRHQASCRGVGCDCLGLVRGVWREVMGAEPERPPAYTPDWAEATGEERMLAAATRHLLRVRGKERAGDVLLFRMLARGPAKHAAILVSARLAGGTVIHAYSGHGVCETRLGDAWLRRLAGVFRFPGS